MTSRRGHISCRIESVYAMREIIALTKFTSIRGAEYPIHSMTAAYNVQTKDARIYAEFERTTVKIIEEDLDSKRVGSVDVITFSPKKWETESARALADVIECSGKPGFSLHQSINAPRAASNAGNTTGSSSAGGSAPFDGAAGGYGGRASDEEDEPAPGPRSQERNKRRRGMSPPPSGRSDEGDRIKNTDMFNFMRTVYDDEKRKHCSDLEIQEQVASFKHQNEMAVQLELVTKLRSEADDLRRTSVWIKAIFIGLI